MNSEMQVLDEILKAREQRARTQSELINIFRTTLISFTLNIPGSEKNNPSFTKVCAIGIDLLEEELKKQNIKIINKVVRNSAAGAEAFLNVAADAISVKRITVSIEEKNDLGRLFDLDVFTSSGELISRSQLALSERKCLLCGESAKVCGRSRKHSIEELLNKVYDIIDIYTSN